MLGVLEFLACIVGAVVMAVLAACFFTLLGISMAWYVLGARTSCVVWHQHPCGACADKHYCVLCQVLATRVDYPHVWSSSVRR